MNSTTLIVLIAALLAFAYFGYRNASGRANRARQLAPLRNAPAAAADFTTPEGAILMLEDAFRRRDLEAAVAAKDFRIEAELESQAAGVSPIDRDVAVEARAGELEAQFRALMTQSWPDFTGVISFFVERQPYRPSTGHTSALSFAVVTEVNRYAQGGDSQHRILVAETPRGWRVLNPLG